MRVCDGAVKMWRLGPARLTLISSKGHSTMTIFGQRRTFCMLPQPHRGHSHQPQGYADIYIDNTTGLTANLPSTKNNKWQLEAAVYLAIKVAARPNDSNEPILRKKMVTEDKLTVEGGLSEMKIILGWHFDFQTLTVTLPEHKHMWSQKILLTIWTHKTTRKTLESTIGHMDHNSFMIPWVYHFLCRLRSLLVHSWNRRMITTDNKCTNNLVLMQLILDKTQRGIDMNLLAFRSPDQIHYSNSCPAAWELQQSRTPMVIQSPRHSAILSNKQLTRIIGCSDNAMDWHHHWQTRMRRLCTVNDG